MKPNFSGEYVLNRNSSTLGPAASPITSARISFTHEDPQFCCSARFVSDDGAMEFTFERFTDGRTMEVGENETSRCYWDSDAIVSEDQSGTGENAFVMTWRYELLDEGRHLRATERIRGGGRDQDNVWEFERQ